MEVRPARDADLPALIHVARDHGGSEALPGALRERYRTHPSLFVVADGPDGLVGEAHGRPRRPEEDPTGKTPDAVLLDRIAVVPTRRGEGVGRRLLAAFETRAAEAAPIVEVAAGSGVEGFYRACGYEPWAVLVQGVDRTDSENATRAADDDEWTLLGTRRVGEETWWYVVPSSLDADSRNHAAERFDARGTNVLFRKRVRS